MQLVLLAFISSVMSLLIVWGTGFLCEKKRSWKMNLFLLLIGLVVCCLSSVIADCVIKAGRPTFYFHTHRPGRATLRIFGISCLAGGFFYALFLMITERRRLKRTIFCWLVRSFLIAGCGAILLEIGYFNFRHFELIGANAPLLQYTPDKIYAPGMYFNRASWKFHPYDHPLEPGIEVYLGYQKVRNISYAFDDGSPQTVVRLKYNDETHRNYISIPDHVFIQGIPRSFSIPLHTVGVTYSILLTMPELIAPDESFGISMNEIKVNSILPLEIKPVRFVLCFLSIFLVSAFFPGSPLWRLPLDFHSVPQMSAVLGLILCIFCFFVWTVFSSYTGSELSITDQKAALNENYQQYNKLIDALMVPRYALLDIPHHYLEKDGDPYDMQLREGRQYDYLWDTAYYDHQYFVYFGVVPAVTILLPYKLLTGDYLDLDFPILGFSCVFVIGLYGVYSLLVRRYFRKISFGLYWSVLLLLLTSLNLTWCLRRTLVYELAITSGICFAVWGIYFMLLTDEFHRATPFCFFFSGACSALSVGCRPTGLFVSIVVFMIGFTQVKMREKRLTGRQILNCILFLLPYAAIGLALMKYNYERFGDPFEFGITYQLTTENRAAGLPLLGVYGRVLSILASWFTLPTVDLSFPFIHIQTPTLPYNGMILDSDNVLGMFAYPLFGFLFLLPVLKKRITAHSGFLIRFIIACLIAVLAISIVASDYAITNRYLTDYLYLAALPAVIVLFCFYEKLESSEIVSAGQAVILICAIIGVGLFAVLSLTGEENWLQRINPLYFEKLRYWMSPWL